MRLRNIEIDTIYKTLLALGDKQQDIAMKFDLVKKIRPLKEEIDSINDEVQRIIAIRHEEDESVTSLSAFDDDYIALMNYENEIDFDGLTLEYLAKFNPSTLQLSNVSKIIK